MSKLTAVRAATFELPNSKVIEVGDTRWQQWLDSDDSKSFRFEDCDAPYTCKKENPSGKNAYWYGYRKVAGKLHKRYIGKSSEVTIERLVEIGELLKVSPEPRFKPIEPIESVRPQDSQLRKDIAALYAMNARLAKIAEPGGYTPAKVAKAATKAQAPLMAAVKALEAMDDVVVSDC